MTNVLYRNLKQFSERVLPADIREPLRKYVHESPHRPQCRRAAAPHRMVGGKSRQAGERHQELDAMCACGFTLAASCRG
jgi:hypothetical protein